MSDQGDAGQWRPATRHNEQQPAADDTTGPLPAVSDEDGEAPGFPPVRGQWSAAAEDDAPTGGFSAVPPAGESPAPGERSIFEPVDRTKSPSDPATPEAEDPGPDGTTPRFGTEVPEPEPNPSSGEPATGESSFGPGSSREPAGGFRSYGSSSYGSNEPEESSFGSFRESSFGSAGFDAKPSASAVPYRTEFSAETAERESSTAGPFTPPAPDSGVSAEAQAEENDFFASDDHPPLWDKVVAPAGPPPKPGKPSSGNLRLPEWMRDDNGDAVGPPSGPGTYEEDNGGRSRRPLFVGLGVLVAGLVAAAGVYLLKGNGDNQESNTAAPTRTTTQAPSSAPTGTGRHTLAGKNLPRFKGTHTKATGRINDAHAGLSYARFAAPWAIPAKNSPMTELGFSASQFAVTEKAGSQPKHWARLMSTQLSGAAKAAYGGPGTEQAAAGELAKVYEARMFNFRHRKRVLASQPLNLGGHQGWLVSDYLTYHRPGVKATGDVVAVAVVDTGRKAPGVLFMSVPNTSKNLWPDVDYVTRTLRVI